MTKHDEMLEALDQLKMLTDEGMFENKEWGGKKVAPDPQQQDTRMEALADLSTKLHEKDQRLIKKDKELQEREELLRVEKKKFEKERAQKLQEEKTNFQKENARIQKEDSVLFVERGRLSTLKMSLDRQAKDLELRRKIIQEREEKIQVKEGKHRARKESLKDLTQSLELAQSSVEQEKRKSEELRKRVEVMDEATKDNALIGLKLFVRMWKNEILDMIKRDKLRCIIPWDTSTWFRANYYKLDSVRLEDLRSWLSDYLDVKIARDLRIDIDTQVPRFVIFYRESKLKKYATESWNGNTQMALKNMHHIQDDDWDQVDEKLKAQA
jgi:hypothetical protein